MSDEKAKLSGPDLTQGVELSTVPDGTMLLGHAQGEPVLLVRRGDEVFAIGAICTHYGAPLEQGLLVGDTVRCPWHHACFSLRTGEALRAPALDPVSSLARRRGARRGASVHASRDAGRCRLRSREAGECQHRDSHSAAAGAPGSVIIVGGGAAGNAAAETLRREGYGGRITMLSADESMPCDRPNLSKGYLAGTASDESNLLRPAEILSETTKSTCAWAHASPRSTQRAGMLSWRMAADTPMARSSSPPAPTRCGSTIPGGDLPHVHYLRTLADSRALVAKALAARRAVVIGASFIGLEVAASLRARNIDVHVVAPETIPMEKILGPEVGNFIRRLHEEHGVTFHLGATATAIDERSVTLKNGENLQADLVVVGIGVRPAISLAERAGLAVDRGVTVDEYLETSVPRIFAAGDIARWPDRLTGERIRVEHFVVAERQGQTAARNILGRTGDASTPSRSSGPNSTTSASPMSGTPNNGTKPRSTGSSRQETAPITYRRGGKKLAVAVVHRDLEGLRAEVEFERV